MRSTPTRALYEHRQTGWVTLLAAFGPVFGFVIVPPQSRYAGPYATWALPVLLVFVVLVVVNFSALTVQVTAERIVLRFGLGPFRKTIRLAMIERVEITRTRWYEGWGVRWTRRGTLYNVSGFDAVRLHLVGGKSVLIGSDDVVRLKSVIDRARSRPAPASH